MVWYKQFGNIPSQPRYKRRIECFWDSVNKMYLPLVPANKHRFTLYQAHLNTNQLNRIKNNNFIEINFVNTNSYLLYFWVAMGMF